MDSVIGEEVGRVQTIKLLIYYTYLGHVLQKGQQVLS